MLNLIIQVPDELVPSLEGIAASRRMSIQQLAVDRLRSLVTGDTEPRPGSALALLRVMGEPPHLCSADMSFADMSFADMSFADMDELDAAISSGRLPVRSPDLF